MPITRLALLTVACRHARRQIPAQTLRERMQEGVSRVHEGASDVQKGVSGVAGKIDESVDSSVDLMTNEPTPQETRDELDAIAGETLARLFAEQPEAADLLELSAGYAVFDTGKLVLFGVATGAGRGVAVSRTDDERIYMNMGTAGVGMSLGIGGFENSGRYPVRERVGFHRVRYQRLRRHRRGGNHVRRRQIGIRGPFRRRPRDLRADQTGMEGICDSGWHQVLGRQESQLIGRPLWRMDGQGDPPSIPKCRPHRVNLRDLRCATQSSGIPSSRSSSCSWAAAARRGSPQRSSARAGLSVRPGPQTARRPCSWPGPPGSRAAAIGCLAAYLSMQRHGFCRDFP